MLSSLDYLILPLIACLAVCIDWLLGEPKRFHPLVGFGNIAKYIEKRLNPSSHWSNPRQRAVGVLALVLLLSPFLCLAIVLQEVAIVSYLADLYLLYFAIGHKSLHDHASAVRDALKQQDIAAAKTAASYMVSRDSAAIDPVPATVESVLENGNDGVFGALFWFFVAGGVGALMFRLINTMDAMWGYKKPRYLYFGWGAARLDDVVSYVPARLTALTYALLGDTTTAFHAWRQQAPLWDSPNAGPVMASGAGAMRVQLGGPACYQGEWHARPVLGAGRTAKPKDIDRSLGLVRCGVLSWVSIALLLSVAMEYMNA